MAPIPRYLDWKELLSIEFKNPSQLRPKKMEVTTREKKSFCCFQQQKSLLIEEPLLAVNEYIPNFDLGEISWTQSYKIYIIFHAIFISFICYDTAQQ